MTSRAGAARTLRPLSCFLRHTLEQFRVQPLRRIHKVGNTQAVIQIQIEGSGAALQIQIENRGMPSLGLLGRGRQDTTRFARRWLSLRPRHRL